ncbi:MAG: Crp/Fnr family transcriptional regulator [Acidobacteriota bacterium]|nr:Crp/Fnr family transcriptional regulator [Acidobacteriota bacterium]
MSRHTLTFNSRNFLKRVGTQKTTREYQDQQAIYTQGDAADAMFHIQNGNVKLVVESPHGKKAVIAILGPGDVFGEGCLVNRSLRMSTATAIHPSTISCVTKGALIRLIHQQPAFAKVFISYLLSRMGRVEEDFVDRLFNFSEKRLARILLMLAHFGKEGGDGAAFPRINQEQLAQMVGTTRSRVSHFMNKFRDKGFVDYNGNGALTVHGDLLSAVLHDQS